MKRIRLKNPAQRPFLWLLTLAAAWACSAAGNSPRYAVVPLGTPGTEETWSEKFMYPQYINNKGDVVGSRGNGVVLYRDGTIYELGYPREPLEAVGIWAINDRGEILGIAFAGSAVSFVLQSLPRPLPVAEARDLPVSSFLARDFNNYGTIIGYIYNREDDTDTPVVYDDGRITELPSLVPGGYATPVAINSRGQILGEAALPDGIDRPYGAPGLRAVVWSGGRIENLGTLPGFYDFFGRDINDRGEVVGACLGWEGYAGFIYRNGVMRRLPFPPGARHTFATHINNAGDVLINVVPWRENDNATLPYDSYWLYSDGALHELTPLVAQASGWPVQWLSLHDMNDRGEIIGIAQYDDGHGGALIQGILLVPSHNRN
jgi:uncharacterized membrane protein